jgi:hypothetical protein
MGPMATVFDGAQNSCERRGDKEVIANPHVGIREPLETDVSPSTTQADDSHSFPEDITRRGKGPTLTALYERPLKALPRALAHSSRTNAGFTMGGIDFKTKNFRTTEWKLASNINVNGRAVETLEVYSCEHGAKLGFLPFQLRTGDLSGRFLKHLG